MGLRKEWKISVKTLNKKTENIKNQSQIKNSITDIKNTLVGIDSRVEEAEEWISNLEDRVMEIKKLNRKEKNNKK